jgi:ankyrin repeat protein
MEAAQRGSTRLAGLLLDAGADPDARDRVHGTALDVAERAGHAELARLLRARGARGSG